MGRITDQQAVTRTLEARNPHTVSFEDKKPVNIEATEWIGPGTVSPITTLAETGTIHELVLRFLVPFAVTKPGTKRKHGISVDPRDTDCEFYFRFSSNRVEKLVLGTTFDSGTIR